MEYLSAKKSRVGPVFVCSMVDVSLRSLGADVPQIWDYGIC